ncbi:uncharacterized protein PGTG_05267 [Puccinia graminis f. sp. tritici CRL 75-36-700-3]|uniref:Retrotransposon gag domain-containing protein n=1 Tax=Puccinia graminis f. sp. tritici (strain CRL 75-36-700-3 / race SCCL) TaxID=418459 RepID=E3K6P6_PUCGT|nr:uncharacterized protein PGTG_05267 [Puccinia graminis f. sp. tritici CRL 75-36-700-3]EFP80042.1 hypothetical protein PGTG_05267 [Puccinia graminis f. sp. tritici CRL 75-36-700-3]
MTQAFIHDPDEHFERDVDFVFEGWSYNNCPTYDGHITIDVWRWLETLSFTLEIRVAHPDIWHLVGFRLIKGHALHVLNEALESGNEPRDWDSFCQWAQSLNHLAPHVVNAYNRCMVADDYEKLRQRDNETAKEFCERFSHWQLKAGYHRYTYEPRTAFVDRLNNDLRPRVCSRITDMKLQGLPISFPTVVHAAFNEDACD